MNTSDLAMFTVAGTTTSNLDNHYSIFLVAVLFSSTMQLGLVQYEFYYG